MSWSIGFIGKPANISAAIEKQSEKLNGQSKIEFDDAAPHLKALVEQNFASDEVGYETPTLEIQASGSGSSVGEKQLSRSLTVSIKQNYGSFV